VANSNICSCLRRDSCVEVQSLSVPLCASLPLAVLHHMHRARLPHTSQVRCHLTLFMFTCCVGRSFFGAEEIGHTRWPTEIFAHACVENKCISTPFMCMLSCNKAKTAATSFASLKYSAFLQLIMVRRCGVLRAEQCWVVLWTPN